jgi:nitrate reductase NapE component
LPATGTLCRSRRWVFSIILLIIIIVIVVALLGGFGYRRR